MNPTTMPPWKHALLGLLYGAVFSVLVLVGGSNRNGPASPMLYALAGIIPLLFAGLAAIYRDDFWERALFKNKETRRRMLGWLIGIILILLMFRLME